MKENFLNYVINEVGYKENTNNDNKYGEYFNKNNLSWCCLFISYCARKCNISNDIIPTFSGCGTGYKFYYNKNKIYQDANVGDLAFFKPTKRGATCSHVGIVIEVNDQYIKTVEGNAGVNTDGVYIFTYKKSYNRFLGFGRPNYENEKHVDILYQAYDNSKNSWLGVIKNYNNDNSNGYAGIIGHSIGGLRIKISDGSKVYVKSHVLGNGWLSEIDKWDDTNNGYSGIKGKSIDSLMIKSDEYKLLYRVHLKKSKRWLDWVSGYDINDKIYGYAGNIGSEIDALQVKIA